MCIKNINGPKIIKYSLIIINGSVDCKAKKKRKQKNVVNAYIVFFSKSVFKFKIQMYIVLYICKFYNYRFQHKIKALKAFLYILKTFKLKAVFQFHYTK